MAMSETLKVLRAAVRLEEFTQPELAAVSGASYEMVKKVLRAERDRRTVEKLDRSVSGSVGRPRLLWRVIDRPAIERRIDASLADAEGPAETSSRPGEVAPMHSPHLEAALSAAEDRLVFALNTADGSDAAGFARDALAEIEDHEDELAVDDRGSGDPPPPPHRNVPVRVGRAEVIRAMSDYLTSDEHLGLEGPLWRRAFDAVGTFDHSRQAGLHKFFLVSLIDHAQRQARSGQAPGADATGQVGIAAAVGVALETSSFEIVVCDAAGDVVDRRCGALPDEPEPELDDVLRTIVTSVKEVVADGDRFHGAGEAPVLGVQVASARRRPIGFPYREKVPLDERLEEATGLPTTVETGANAFAVEEQWSGVGGEGDDFALLLVAETVGASVVQGGQLSTGPRESAAWTADVGTAAILEDIGGNGSGPVVRDLAEAIALARQEPTPDDDHDHDHDPEQMAKVALRAFESAGQNLGRWARHLIDRCGSPQLVVYGPEALLDRTEPAGRAFLDELEKLGDGTPDPSRPTFLRSGPVYRPLRRYDAAHAAALVALRRFGRTAGERGAAGPPT